MLVVSCFIPCHSLAQWEGISIVYLQRPSFTLEGFVVSLAGK
jgi:hypothetical protein